MKIDGNRVRQLRNGRQWSQEQLAEACGINLRTIQRIESRGTGSLESVRALAAVFGVKPNELMVREESLSHRQLAAVKTCLFKYADFSGLASRFEYWWFFAFAMLLTAIGAAIHDAVAQILLLAVLLPLLAAGTRRLRETGRSGWWQLLFLVPGGCIAVFWLLAMQARGGNAQPKAA